MTPTQTVFLALLLAVIVALLAPRVQKPLQAALRRTPNLVWLAPPLLTAIFCVASILAGSVNPELLAIVLVYTAAPTLCARLAGPGPAARPANLDFGAILLLWFPLEFPAGAARLIAERTKASCTAWPTPSLSCLA